MVGLTALFLKLHTSKRSEPSGFIVGHFNCCNLNWFHFLSEFHLQKNREKLKLIVH